MLYSSNLIAVVGSSEDSNLFSSKRLTLWNTNNYTAICEISFPSKVQSVKINKFWLVVAVKENIHIYDLNNMKLLTSIDSKNYGVGRLVLAPNFTSSCFLCYSDSIIDGKVSIYDCNEMVSYKPIDAHTAPVLKLAINMAGNKLVTASCKGTVIRVWRLPNGELIHSFHWGIHNTYIHSLNFSVESNYVICSTAKGSIHVFQMDKDVDEDQ